MKDALEEETSELSHSAEIPFQHLQWGMSTYCNSADPAPPDARLPYVRQLKRLAAALGGAATGPAVIALSLGGGRDRRPRSWPDAVAPIAAPRHCKTEAGDCRARGGYR